MVPVILFCAKAGIIKHPTSARSMKMRLFMIVDFAMNEFFELVSLITATPYIYCRLKDFYRPYSWELQFILVY